MRPTQLSLAGLAAAALMLAPLESRAVTTSAPMDVTATVAEACSITTTPMSFGAYSPLANADVDASGTFTVTCTKGTTYQYMLGTTLAMVGATSGDSLGFAIYSDVSGGAAWTLDTLNTTPIIAKGTAEDAVTVYGRIPGGQNVSADNYDGEITVTVEF